MDAGYLPANTDPPLANLEWIQIIYSNNSVYVDPIPGSPNPNNPGTNYDNLPFYYDIGKNDNNNKQNDEYTFYDAPSRPYPPPPPQGVSGVSWGADLLLTSWNLQQVNGTVTIYGGVGWGWYIQRYPKANAPMMRDDAFPAQSVPEPSSVVSLLIGVGLLSLRLARSRRRGHATRLEIMTAKR